jgi:hypothetical protein
MGKLDGGEVGILPRSDQYVIEIRADNKYLQDGEKLSSSLLGLAGSLKSLSCPPETDTK